MKSIFDMCLMVVVFKRHFYLTNELHLNAYFNLFALSLSFIICLLFLYKQAKGRWIKYATHSVLFCSLTETAFYLTVKDLQSMRAEEG